MFTILYVDDEPMLLEIAQIFLEKTGDFRVETITSAPEALKKMAANSYDCIISDYQMPEMDGIALLKAVRSRGNIIPFIIFTGRGREEVVIDALNNGADFYLQKGGDPKAQFVELAHKIRQAIQIKIAQKTMLDLVQGAPIPEFVLDSDHRVIFWNRALEEYSGVAASDVVGTTDHWKAFYPSQRPCLADLIVDGNTNGIVRWYDGKQAASQLRTGNFVATDFFPAMKGGTWLYFTAAPLRDPTGKITGAVETLQDVTSIRQKEEELQRAYQQLHAAYEQVRASEHLVKNGNELKETRAELERTKEALGEVNRKLRHLAGITRCDTPDGVFCLPGEREETAGLPPDRPVGLYNHTLETAAMAVRELIAFTGVYQDKGPAEPVWQSLARVIAGLDAPRNLAFSVDLPPFEVYAGPGFPAVFADLLDNSVRHGRDVSRVSVSAEETREGLTVIWEDDGSGTHPDRTEPVSGQDNRRQGWTGLDRARAICSLTGIAVQETSSPGRGARVEIRVPGRSCRRAGAVPSPDRLDRSRKTPAGNSNPAH